MFFGIAAGNFLPPMNMYKGQYCYEGSTQSGLAGAVYDSTLSGWFDARTSE